MRLELKASDIHVALIEPGPIATRFSRPCARGLRAQYRRGASHYRDIYVRQRKTPARGPSRGRFKLPPEAVLDEAHPCA